jgi:hypothetical protein
MDRDEVGACVKEPVELFGGVRDHQVHVEGQGLGLLERLDDRGADRQVGDEMPVHDVHVQPFGPRLSDEAHVALEVEEVRREQRGRQLYVPEHARPSP